jgi:glycolate dehydrogenase FAD-binding subunit
VVEMSPATIKEKVDVWGHSRSDLRVVRSLKAEIDPVGVLNPGRFVGGI